MPRTLSSGVGICGISAAIATAGAIEAPPIYATMISSIIVIFAAIELIIVPWLGAYFFPHHLNAAGVWMALSIKTDGAAAAGGGVVSGLLGQGPTGVPAVMAVTTKVLIDVWIGLIALILAAVFTYYIDKKPGAKVDPMILWYRFPKFVLGYFFTSLVLSAIAFTYPTVAAGAAAVAPVAELRRRSSAGDLLLPHVHVHRNHYSLLCPPTSGHTKTIHGVLHGIAVRDIVGRNPSVRVLRRTSLAFRAFVDQTFETMFRQ